MTQPSTPDNTDVPDEQATARRWERLREMPIPEAVIMAWEFALAATAVSVVLATYFFMASFISYIWITASILFGLVLVCLALRDRHGCRFARGLTLLGAVGFGTLLGVYLTLGGMGIQPGVPAVPWSVEVALIFAGGLTSLAIFSKLGEDGALSYFDMACPQCASTNGEMTSFVGGVIRCRSCATRW